MSLLPSMFSNSASVSRLASRSSRELRLLLCESVAQDQNHIQSCESEENTFQYPSRSRSAIRTRSMTSRASTGSWSPNTLAGANRPYMISFARYTESHFSLLNNEETLSLPFGIHHVTSGPRAAMDILIRASCARCLSTMSSSATREELCQRSLFPLSRHSTTTSDSLFE